MNKIKAILRSNNKEYSILAKIHSRDSLEEYQLDPVDFYEKWGGEKPDGSGYEVEILNHNELNSFHQEMNKSLDSDKNLIPLNIHQGKDDKIYMCYTKHLEYNSESTSIFKKWSHIVFAQIFLGLTYQKLGEAIDSDCFYECAEYALKQLSLNNLKITYGE